jgi:hypothetical protein
MHGLAFDVWAQLGAERLVRDEVDGASQQVLEIELQAEVAGGGGRPLEANEEVDVARLSGTITGHGTEQRQVLDVFRFPWKVASAGVDVLESVLLSPRECNQIKLHHDK